MRTFLVGDRRFRNRPISYYVLADELENVGENYGLRVEYGGDVVNIHGITVSQPRILELLGLLIRGCVPPCAVRDVVEDWLLR